MINSKQNNVGQQAGAIALLERIQCRQKPEYWYQALLGIMMDMSLDDLVQEMEPDFYNQRIKSKGNLLIITHFFIFFSLTEIHVNGNWNTFHHLLLV